MAPIPIHYRVTVFDVDGPFGLLYDESFQSEDLAHDKFVELVEDCRGHYPLLRTEVQTNFRCIVFGDHDQGLRVVSEWVCT